MISKQLANARDYVRLAKPDKLTLEEIVTGCLKVLQQSPSNYSAWVGRHKVAIRRFDRTAIVRLIELTISDVEASPFDYPPVWQFEQFNTRGALSKAAKRAKGCICVQCGKTFHPERKTKYCSQSCKNRAAYRRSKAVA
jgi:hypothetical protein